MQLISRETPKKRVQFELRALDVADARVDICLTTCGFYTHSSSAAITYLLFSRDLHRFLAAANKCTCNFFQRMHFSVFCTNSVQGRTVLQSSRHSCCTLISFHLLAIIPGSKIRFIGNIHIYSLNGPASDTEHRQ
jgi:hypothetical protein